MGGKASRDKGSRGERELFALLSDRLGFVITRNLSQTRDAGCDSLSVPGFTIECKRVESPFRDAWMAQAVAAIHRGHAIPVVFYRASRHPWRAAFRAADLMKCPAYIGLVHLDLDDAATFMHERV
ncbi:hypothetical protein [Acidithiobacillus sp.]